MPRHIFENMFKGVAKLQANCAAISIHDPKLPVIVPNDTNVINLWFSDAEDFEESSDIVLFTETMADDIFKFVEANRCVEHWIVHCTMGSSRSGAVGGFLADYFGIEWEDFFRDNSQVKPNSLVKKLLTRKIWRIDT